MPRGEHVAGAVVGEQPGGLLPQRIHERPVGQGSPGQRGGLPGADLRPGLRPAWRASSSASLVLPMPAGPVISSTWDWPAAARA